MRPPAAVPMVLLVAVLGISGSGPLVRLSAAAPLAIAVGRLSVSMLIIALILSATGSWREWRRLSRADVGAALAAGLFLALHFWSWIASVRYTSVAASVVLVNVHPVLVAAGSALFLRERPSRTQLVGIIIALGGAALLAWSDARDAALMAAGAASVRGPSDPLRGDLLAVLGAVTIAAYMLTGRRVRQQLGLWPYVGLVYGACWVVLLLAALATRAPLLPQPPHELALFTAMAVGPMLIGHTGFNWALRFVPAYVVSLVAIAEPIGATALAAFLPGIGERPGALTLLGGAILLSGIMLAARRRADAR